MTWRNKIAVIAILFAGVFLIVLFRLYWVRWLAGNKVGSSSRGSQSAESVVESPASGVVQIGWPVMSPGTQKRGIPHTHAPAEKSEQYHLACDTFRLWVQDYLQAPVQRRTETEASGLKLAQERRQALRELIRTDPERALSERVAFSLRRQLPAVIQRELEEVVGGRGDLDVFCALPVEGANSGSAVWQRWVAIGVRSYEAHVFGRRLSQPSQRGISLHGIAVDDYLALSEGPAQVLEPDEQSAAATAAIRGVGEKSVLVMLVDFSDRPGGSTDTASALTEMNWVNLFYQANSFQQMSFTRIDVTPVLRLPSQSGVYVASNPGELLRDARSVAAVAGFAVESYDFEVVALSYVGFSWSGLGNVGSKGAFVQGSPFRRFTVAHELGHNLGNWHAGLWVASDESLAIGSGTRSEYGNLLDIMGASTVGHMNANLKYVAGWLDDAHIHTVSESGQYRIHAVDAGAPLELENRYALRIRMGDWAYGVPTDYWIDFRQQFTNDLLACHGACVKWASDAAGEDHNHLLDMNPGTPERGLDAPLLVGRTFADRQRGIYITPLARGGASGANWLDVVVNFGGVGNRAPTANLATSALAAQPGEAIHFAVTASDPDGDLLAYSWDFGDRSILTNSLNQPTADKAWSAEGEYVVRCIISDLKGGEAIVSVLVRVGNPTGFHIIGRVLWRGQPLSGVRVHNGTGHPNAGSALTGADGQFALVGLTASNYTLYAVKPDFYFVPAFTNLVTVGPQHVENLLFRAETNTAMMLTGFIPSGGFIGDAVAIRGINLQPPMWPDGVTFGGMPATYSFLSATQIAAVVPDAAVTGPVVVKSQWYGGHSATSEVPFTVFPTPPGIKVQPRSHTNGAGFTVTFQVTASGSAPFTYQWRKDGMDLPQSTGRLLIVSNTQPADAGAYQVVVANSAGSITSVVATLKVLDSIDFAEALDTTNLVWSTGGDEGWLTQTNAAYDGVDAAESG